jgi:Coenzyme PQQ synthesis protein D (PqqD)
VTAATYIRSGRTLQRNAGPDVLAMVPDEGRVHVLSGPAAVIWDILGERASIADVTDDLARRYERPAEEIRSSVEDCVRSLARRGLVEERQ